MVSFEEWSAFGDAKSERESGHHLKGKKEG